MALYGVTADGRMVPFEFDSTDLPVRVDDTTTVGLTSEHELVIHQQRTTGLARVTVTDAEALTRAMGVALAAREERIASDLRPMLDDQRKAIFAALKEYFGTLSDAERLRKVSKLAGKDITSMSRKGNMTRADASRVLSIFDEFSE